MTRGRFTRRLLAALLVSVTSGGCAMAGAGGTGHGAGAGADRGWSEEGIASWYGEPFHGRTTASGERYDMNAPTAAHKTLPFGSRVRIENLDNGRTTTLTINDRGPFVRGRIIDVSRWGAEQLGMVGAGVARVRITVVEGPAPACWEVQAGAFAERSNAEGLRDRLRNDGYPARMETAPDGLLRVRIGPYDEQGAAEAVTRRVNGVLLAC